MNSTVRIVIPCYNYARSLRSCVEPVLAQDGVALQVLIIDDCSSDGSQQVAASLAAGDSRVEVRHHSANQGHRNTYNEGLEWAAQADYALALDADDGLTPGSLQRSVAMLDAHPEMAFVYGPSAAFRGDGPFPQPRRGPMRWKVWRGHDWFEKRCIYTENPVCSSLVLMRPSVLLKTGRLRNNLPHTGDFELWMRLSLYGDAGFVAGADQGFYREHAAGMHNVSFGTELKDLTEVKKAFDVVFRDHSHRITDAERLSQTVNKMLARRALRAACRALELGPATAADAPELEALATAAFGDIARLPEWAGLWWRKRLGPVWSRRVHPFLILTRARRFAQRLRHSRRRSGGL